MCGATGLHWGMCADFNHSAELLAREQYRLIGDTSTRHPKGKVFLCAMHVPGGIICECAW
jgi:hypothetical protein